MTESTNHLESQEMTIGELVERHNDRREDPVADGFDRFVGVEELDSDELRLRRWGEAANGGLPPTFRFVFRAGMILFPTRRPALRKCAVAPFDGITGEKLLVLSNKSQSPVIDRLLPFLLVSERVRQWVIDRAIGSVTPHFRWRDLAACPVAIPSRPQQEAIADVLLTIEESIASQGTLIEKNLVVQQSLLEAVLQSSQSQSCVFLGDVARAVRGISYRATEVGSSGEYTLLSLKNVEPGGGYRPEGLKHFTGGAKLDHKVNEGDLLIAVTDLTLQRELIGAPLLVPHGLDSQAVFSLDLAHLKVDERRASSRFLFWSLRARRIRQRMKSLGTGTTVMHLDLETAMRTKILLPPLREQHEIVAQLDQLESCVQSGRHRLERLREFRIAASSHLLEPTEEQ